MLPGAHLRLPGRHAGARAHRRAERSLWIVEDACEALGAVHADGATVGARGNLAVFGFYPNKQLTTGEGGAVVAPAAEAKERIDSERNQGRAPDMGWLDHDRLGLQLPARRPLVRPGPGAARAPRRDAGRARPRGRALLRGAGRGGGARAPVPGRGRRPAQLVRLRGPASARRGPRRGGAWRCASAAWTRSPTCRRSTSISFYRERFGHREGEFPVCEDVARRSLALPFFPGLTDGEVERVVDAVARGGYREAHRRSR